MSNKIFPSHFVDGIATPRSRTPSVTSPLTSIYYTDLICPTNATSIVECNVTRAVNEACLSGEQEYFVTCFNVSGKCKYCVVLIHVHVHAVHVHVHRTSVIRIAWDIEAFG